MEHDQLEPADGEAALALVARPSRAVTARRWPNCGTNCADSQARSAALAIPAAPPPNGNFPLIPFHSHAEAPLVCGRSVCVEKGWCTLSAEDPGFPEWPDGEEDDPDVCGNAWLSVDQETRVCRVAMQGPAAAILRLLDPADENGMLEMLSMEAMFDEIVIGLLNEGEEEDSD